MKFNEYVRMLTETKDDAVSNSFTLILNAGDAEFKIFISLPEPMPQNMIGSKISKTLKQLNHESKKEDVVKALLSTFKDSKLMKTKPESSIIFKKYI